MKCPHCRVEINPVFQELLLGPAQNSVWSIFKMICPSPQCTKLILQLKNGSINNSAGIPRLDRIQNVYNVWPLTSSRPPAPPEVDKPLAMDFNEACLVLPYSPKASAALSRRCLQLILREKAKVTKADLAKEIQEVIDKAALPSYLIESIDAIRNVGNFAAHPLKSTSTGDIVDVESGEAEWLLDVLESLFDFYFVQPALLQTKRDQLNKKLGDIGKPPMK